MGTENGLNTDSSDDQIENRCLALKKFQDFQVLVTLLAAFLKENFTNATYSALLGQARDFGTGAKSITLATMAIIERACSRFHGGDKKRCHQKEILLKPLFKEVKKK